MDADKSVKIAKKDKLYLLAFMLKTIFAGQQFYADKRSIPPE